MTHRIFRRFRRTVTPPLLAALLISMTITAPAGAGTAADRSDPPPHTATGPLLAKGLGSGGGPTVSPSVASLATDVGLQAEGAGDAGPLPASPALGSLTAPETDLFEVDLAEGARIELTLPAPVTGDPAKPAIFDLYLFAPGLDQLTDAVAVAHATAGPYPRTLTYVVPSGAAGTYYIEVNAWQGLGDYELTWLVREPGENLRVDIDQALALPIPNQTDLTLVNAWGANSLYALTLTGGTRVRIDLAGPADADFDLYLYGPGTASILPASTQPAAFANLPGSNESIIFDVPGGAGGTYHLEVYRFNGAGDATLTMSQGPIPAAPSATRVWGTGRYDTAAAISAEAFPAGSRTAVIASGRSFADGLTASSLAGALRVPVLLSAVQSLPDATALELERLGVDKVYIVGGTSAVSQAVADRIASRGGPGSIEVERVSGGSRYDTAAEVARKTREITGRNPQVVFLASGQNFPDALALSPVAYAQATPILLARATALPAATAEVIPQLKGLNHYQMEVLVAGGTLAVSDTVAAEAAALAGGTLTRVAGASRYVTALAIAEHAVLAGWADPETVAVASGRSFPDALAGAALPGMRGGTLLLTTPAAASVPVTQYLRSFDFALNECWVLGGESAVSATALQTIRDTLPQEPLRY